MKVGDLVKVIAKELRIPVGSVALITKVKPHTDARGTKYQYWAQIVGSGDVFWFWPEYLEVISESR